MISATKGARVGKLTALKLNNVHLNGARIYIDSSTQRNGEIEAPETANAYRELPIGPQIVNLLSQFERTGDLVWPCPEFGAPYRRFYIHAYETKQGDLAILGKKLKCLALLNQDD